MTLSLKKGLWLEERSRFGAINPVSLIISQFRMDSSLRPSPTVNRMSILDKPRTFANPDDLCSEIIGWLQRAPNMDSANAYLEDSQRIHTEVFAKCFQSKERVRRMIGEVRNEDFILLLLQYIAVDR